MKLSVHLMIIILLVYSMAQAASPLPACEALSKQPESDEESSLPESTPSVTMFDPGERVTGRFDEGEMEHLYRFEALPLHAYTLRDEEGLPLKVEITGQDGEVLFSTEGSTDDQMSASGAVHWDCLDGGSYAVRVTPAYDGTSGDYSFTLEEDPGWFAATSLTRFPSQEGSLDYPGDVDYYVFERTGDERVYEITVEGDSAMVLFWVDTEEGIPRALVQGSELSIVENYPGGDLTETDSYYGVSGPAGCFSVEGSEEKDGGLSTWIIVGIVGGVVVIVLGIVAITQIGKDCSCSNPFGSLGSLDNLGCSGN